MMFNWSICFSICLLFYSGIAQFQGDIEYECVDIYKQPAFHHSSMKDHQIQMKPSVEFQAMLLMNSGTSDTSTDQSEERCPKGQVPIHRPQINYTSKFINPMKIIPEANLQYAIVRTFENSTKERWQGAEAVFGIYKPRVKNNQFSKAWIWLNHREEDIISSIQFGWAVHTGLYPDDRPRLTTYWISRRHKLGCYNTLCPGGYVQVHKSIYPGMVYDKVSNLGGKQYSTHLLVGQDSRTKNWLLMSRRSLIGYWPSEIYSMQGASQVYYGGYAGGPSGASSPAMGGGNFPRYGRQFGACYMKQLKYISEYKLYDIDSNHLKEYVNSPNCYGVIFRKFEIGSGEVLTFGGPGGQCGMVNNQ